MPARLVAALLLFFAIGVSACSDTMVSSSPDDEMPPATNTPTVGSALNSFGFAVIADGFSLDETYVLDFSGDTLSLGLAVTDYQGGTASLELYGAGDALLYQKDLGRNVAQGTEQVAAQPERAVLRFEGFTGLVALGISAN